MIKINLQNINSSNSLWRKPVKSHNEISLFWVINNNCKLLLNVLINLQFELNSLIYLEFLSSST